MAFSFGDLFRSFSGAGAEASVLGVDIGAASIKVVQLRSSHGTALLETYGEIALGPYAKMPVGKVVKLTPEVTAQALNDLMKEANVTARTAGIAIPFSSSLINVIDLPKVDAESLKRIVPIEARKYIPVPVSEVSLDWSVIPADEAQQNSAFDQLQQKTPSAVRGQEVLLVAIQNSTLKDYQTIMETAGLTANFVEIEIFSVVRSTLGHGLAPVMVDGAATTKCTWWSAVSCG